MTLTEALELFKLNNSTEITEENIKKVYRNYCFAYHPDAHHDENPDVYQDMMIKINEAYDVLKKYVFFNNIKEQINEKEKQERQQQIVKEQILMDIIVRAYYASKNELDKINSDFLDIFLSIPHRVGRTKINKRTIGAYPHIDKAFENKAKSESELMKKNIEKYAKEFARKYDIEINYLEVIGGEYINFLNGTNWYEKYKNYQEKETEDIKRLT